MSTMPELIDALFKKNTEALKLMLAVPGADVNIQDKDGRTAVHRAAEFNNTEALKLLLDHTSLTALTLNQKDKCYGATPVMWALGTWAVNYDKLEHLALLAEDLRVDLDTTDKEGRSLEERAR